MQESRARLLLKKYREGTLSKEERSLLESWYLELARSKGLSAGKEELDHYLSSLDEMTPPSVHPGKGASRSLFSRVSVAAAVLLSVAFLGYWFLAREEAPAPNDALLLSDALPGDNRAQLTLANGESIFLDEVRSGKLAQEGAMAIVKTQEGELVYRFADSSQAKSSASIAYNKIETPKAGQYRVVLPDGTQAWLNAASSIRFPTLFTIDERVVEITGEVYFEVAKLTRGNRRVPFRVYAGNQAIEVLGTVFNVNSYPEEEAIKTTLIEGSIGVKTKNRSGRNIILKPGQQAHFIPEEESRSANASKIDITEVDTGAVVAWKEGYFKFDGADLPELMRQVSRWYDMEVIYEGPIGAYEFIGRIERNSRLSKVLKILELGGVKFRIEGKKIIVTE